MLRKLTLAAQLALLAAGLVGCKKPDLAEMMKAPPRPAALDELDVFVGKWDGTFEMRMAGEDKPMTMHGTSTFAWDVDRWALVEHSEGACDATQPPARMFGHGVWHWDDHAKVYRYYAVDNYGMIMQGEGRYNPRTQTWKMKSTSSDTRHGMSSCGHGTLKMIDKNTMEWNWVETDSLGLMKFMEMKGTSRRK